MLYYIYIGNGQTAIDHLSKVTDGMFVTVSCADKAAVIIDGIRERYNTSILYEQTDPEKTASTSPAFTGDFHASTSPLSPKDCRQKSARPICWQASATHCRRRPTQRASAA